MQKIWSLKVLGLIVQNKKKSSNIFSIYVQAIEIVSTNTFALTHCHKSTLSLNNLMLKLIMFIEKTKQLYSKFEIKNPKKSKTMFGYQTLKVC